MFVQPRSGARTYPRAPAARRSFPSLNAKAAGTEEANAINRDCRSERPLHDAICVMFGCFLSQTALEWTAVPLLHSDLEDFMSRESSELRERMARLSDDELLR